MAFDVSVKDISAIRQFASRLDGFALGYVSHLRQISNAARSNKDDISMKIFSLRNSVDMAKSKVRKAENDLEYEQSREMPSLHAIETAEDRLGHEEQELAKVQAKLDQAEALARQLTSLLDQVSEIASRAESPIRDATYHAVKSIATAADRIQQYAK